MPRYSSVLPATLQSSRLIDLFFAITRLHSERDCERFFSDLCTYRELQSLADRWEIARLVHAGIPYRAITKQTGASSSTIARVAQCAKFGCGGLTQPCAAVLGRRRFC